MSGIQPIPAKYVDMIRNSGPIQALQSTFDRGRTESSVATEIAAPELSREEAEYTAPVIDPNPTLPTESSLAEEAATVTAESAEILADTVTQDAAAAVSLEDGVSPVEAATELSLTRDAIETPLAVVPVFRLDAATYSVSESGAAVVVRVIREGDLATSASVTWSTVAVSAESQVDFIGYYRRAVEFPPGEKAQTILVPIVSDATAEGDETFRILLGEPGGEGELAEPSVATVTIIDDDF
jgi:hypothetical protein